MLIKLEPQTTTLDLNEGDVVQYKQCDNIYNVLILREHETMHEAFTIPCYRLLDLRSSALWIKTFNTTDDLNEFFRKSGREIVKVFKKNDLILTTKGE